MSSSLGSVVPASPLFVVLNGGSGLAGADERVETLTRVFQSARRAAAFLAIDEPAQLARVAAQAVEQARAANGIVVAAGGDGTINAVAQAVLGSGRPFGVLPQGTFNYFGRAHGIPQDMEAAALALLRARVEPVQVGIVNGQVFLVNASVGLYPRLLEDREAYKNQLGRSRWVALVSGLKTLMREHRRLDLTIESGGQTRQLRTPTLFIGNNALQFERIGLTDAVEALQRDALAAVAVHHTSTPALLLLALRGALGQLGHADQLSSFAFRRLTVRVRSQRNVKVATDGEIHWMRSPLCFEVSPEPLLLLVPDEADRVKSE